MGLFARRTNVTSRRLAKVFAAEYSIQDATAEEAYFELVGLDGDDCARGHLPPWRDRFNVRDLPRRKECLGIECFSLLAQGDDRFSAS
jgi:hypothetical protein